MRLRVQEARKKEGTWKCVRRGARGECLWVGGHRNVDEVVDNKHLRLDWAINDDDGIDVNHYFGHGSMATAKMLQTKIARHIQSHIPVSFQCDQKCLHDSCTIAKS